MPKSVKYLLLATLLGALLPFQHYLGLSFAGLHLYYFWQPITYFFTSGGAAETRVFSLLINGYLLWTFGSGVYARRGGKSLITLFVGGGITAGLLCALALYLLPSPTLLIGMAPAMNALLMGWLILHSDALLRPLLAIPMRSSWLILGMMGIGLFISLSNGSYLDATARVIGAGFGYFYSIIVWKCHSPFQSLHRFESLFFRNARPYGSKIYDFKTGKAVVSDELFLESCLEKIARHGKKSLTLYERWRLFRVAKKVRRS